MFSLEPELEALRPQLGPHTDALIARERREIFSIHPELRIAGWLGATLLATAAGVLLKNNLDRIGPLALAIGIGVAAIACYAWTWWRRSRAMLIDDYVLLLGALLVSADVAFIESQFHILDDAWKHHLLLLAIVHGAGAYVYRSRMLLSLSIPALASYIGFDRQERIRDLVEPAFITAGTLLVWREIDRRLNRATTFSRTFEHFAANIALFGSLTLIDRNEVLGSLLTIAIAIGVIAWGFHTRHEPFVLYGFVYAVIGVDALLITTMFDDAETMGLFIIVVSLIAAVAGLLALHARFKALK